MAETLSLSGREHVLADAAALSDADLVRHRDELLAQLAELDGTNLERQQQHANRLLGRVVFELTQRGADMLDLANATAIEEPVA